MDEELFEDLCKSIKEVGRMRRAQVLKESKVDEQDERTKIENPEDWEE